VKEGGGSLHTEMELFGPYFGVFAQVLKDFSEGLEP